ncbi:MAG: hypothetical protein J6Y38_07050 [Bacteroidaceae bacterium]|nr:hypothetical protein [Bacteroidaceae bacterium]
MKKLLLLGLMLLGLGGVVSVKAGNVYGSCSVANACSWSPETHTMTFTGINGWQILYTGLPSGDITPYKKFHVTLSDMSDNINNVRLCVKDVNDNTAWANLYEGENNIDLIALAEAYPDCDFTNIKNNDITIWSPSSSVSTVDTDHPAFVKIEDVYMQGVKNVVNNILKDEITDLSYLTAGNRFVIANTNGGAIQAYVSNAAGAQETSIASVTNSMYYFFTIEPLPALDINEDGTNDDATYYRVAIKNADGEAKPSSWWGDNYVNHIGWGDLWSTTCDENKEDGYGRDGKFNAVWTVEYESGKGFKFYNPKNSKYMTLRNTSSSVTYVKLYKEIEFNINSEFDKEDNAANDQIFALSKATGYNAETNTITNGGWTFDTPVDLSDWDYLVITTEESTPGEDTFIKITDKDGKSVEKDQYNTENQPQMYFGRWNNHNVACISMDYLRIEKGLDISNITSLSFTGKSIKISAVYLTDYQNTKLGPARGRYNWYVNGDVVREYSTAERFGTICLPYVASYAGAEIYSIASVNADGISLTKLNGLMEAGKPYIYKASDAGGNLDGAHNVNFFRADFDTYDVAEPVENNGLIGTFGDPTAVEYVPQGKNYYVVGRAAGDTEDKIFRVDSEVTLGANRAYIDKSKIADKAAGSRTILLSFDGAEEKDPTAIESTEAVEVLTDGVFYDMSGREVSNLTPGLYIVKYGNVTKKVMIK